MPRSHLTVLDRSGHRARTSKSTNTPEGVVESKPFTFPTEIDGPNAVVVQPGGMSRILEPL